MVRQAAAAPEVLPEAKYLPRGNRQETKDLRVRVRVRVRNRITMPHLPYSYTYSYTRISLTSYPQIYLLSRFSTTTDHNTDSVRVRDKARDPSKADGTKFFMTHQSHPQGIRRIAPGAGLV